MKDLRRFLLSPQLTMPWSPVATVRTPEAAEMLGCSHDTIMRLIEDGTLNAHQRRKLQGSPWIISRESVLEVADQWRRQHYALDAAKQRE